MASRKLNIDNVELNFSAHLGFQKEYQSNDVAAQVRHRLGRLLKDKELTLKDQCEMSLDIVLPAELLEHQYAEYIARHIEAKLK